MTYYIEAFIAGAVVALWIVGSIKFLTGMGKIKLVRKVHLTHKELKEIENASITLKKNGADAETTAALDKIIHGSGIKEVIV